MVVAGGDFNCGAVGAKVDGKTGCVVTAVGFVAELTIEVESPTFDSAIVEDCACVMGSGGDFNCGASGAEVDGCAWCVGVCICSVTELTIEVATPTFDGVVVEDCARVTESGGDFNCGASGAEVDGCAWCVGAGVGSVAELTVKIPSPTFEGSQLEDCARVGSARSQTNGFACN